MNWKVITWYIGISLLLVAALMTVSGVIACLTPGDESRIPLLFSAFLTIIVGGYPILFVRRGRHKLTFQEGNSIVVGAWLMACLFGMFPFLFYGREFTPINALFESISGFTTTGASILNDIEALPRGLQFWRIATAWVGGVGIVTLFSMITAGADKSTLSGAEISTVAREPFAGDRSTSFANRMFLTYIALTVVTFFALKLTGMGWFDAATNAMSACSTCGFCTRNTSIAFYANPAAEVVLTFAMLAAGIHFGILFLAFLKGRPKYIWKSETIKVFLSLVVLAIAAVTVDLMVNGQYHSFGEALRDASFQIASISTTTGFATQDTTLWPPLSMSILIICSLICGCSGSTSGGIKIDRAILRPRHPGRQGHLPESRPHREPAPGPGGPGRWPDALGRAGERRVRVHLLLPAHRRGLRRRQPVLRPGFHHGRHGLGRLYRQCRPRFRRGGVDVQLRGFPARPQGHQHDRDAHRPSGNLPHPVPDPVDADEVRRVVADVFGNHYICIRRQTMDPL